MLYTNQLQVFSNVYHVTDRKLGAGASGDVFMAIDLWRQRQVACKIGALRSHLPDSQDTSSQSSVGTMRKNPFRKAAEDGLRATNLWREVKLLKTLDHVSYSIRDTYFC